MPAATRPRPARRHRRWIGARLTLGVAVLSAALAASACRPSTIRLAFVPRPGTTYRYAIHVRSTTTTTLTGQRPKVRTDAAELVADDTVLAVDASGSTLQVALGQRGVAAHVYQVRLDRQAALISIEEVDGTPAAALSRLQLDELPPAALGAPPDRPLHAGDHWTIDQPVSLPHVAPTRVRGSGRIEGFGVIDGRSVARTTSTAAVSLDAAADRSTAGDPGGAPVGLRGSQVTTDRVTRTLADGAVESSQAATNGTFDIVLLGATGSVPLLTGHLDVDVSSATERVA